MLRRRICAGPSASHIPVVSLSSSSRLSSSTENAAQSMVSSYKAEMRQQQPQHQQQHRSSQTQRNEDASSSWLHRVQAEMISDRDPLLGQYHKDFFRDPSQGYAPNFAPRNYAQGGTVDYHHPQSSLHFGSGILDREASSHEIASKRRQARDIRTAVRSAPSHSERQDVLSRLGGGHPSSSQREGSASAGASLQDAFQASLKQRTAQPFHEVGALHDLRSGPSSLHAGIEHNLLKDQVQNQFTSRNDQVLEEGLRQAHGLREKERFEFDVKQRSERMPFRGYDMDRYLSSQNSNPFGQNLTPPGTSAEAQQNVRRNAVRDRESQIATAFQLNTVSSEPKLGESLTESITDGLRAASSEAQRQAKLQRDAKFGIGRQGPLVQDGGPDRRSLKRHKNDERLLNAMVFRSDAYRKTATDDHIDPVERNEVQYGVGHLLRNHFDIQRREDNFVNGKADPTARATAYYGKPVLQEQDDFVFRRRGARGERPMEYFQPFPQFKDFRLQRVYRDVEGFPALKQRPDFLEWDLFARYRAHYEQRRELALRHGLEPKPNETVTERDERRRKLDELCEQTPFDEARFRESQRHHASERPAGSTDPNSFADAHTLRSHFGWYFLPTPTIVTRVVSPDNVSGGLAVLSEPDSTGATSDKREHLLSSRYLNKLFEEENYRFRVGRQSAQRGIMPDPHLPHKQPESVLQHFSPVERELHDTYVSMLTDTHVAKWQQAIQQDRRWVGTQFATVKERLATPVDVYDIERLSDGAVFTVSANAAADNTGDRIRAALADPARLLSLPDGDGAIVQYRLLEHSKRTTTFVRLALEQGGERMMEEADYAKLEPEISDVNFNSSLGNGPNFVYDYNRSNYVETQDKIWETNTADGSEGWSPATHADGLRAGLPVSCRRVVDRALRLRGSEYHRGVIVSYKKQPFFNPEPRTVTVWFPTDDVVEEIPLSELLIWQRQYYGPERTAGDHTRVLNLNPRRYVHVGDPTGDRLSNGESHFLEKYQNHSPDAVAERLQSLKHVQEIDDWTVHDQRRPENHRPLSINHRKDYISKGYMHRYTPWNWILTQEADQPMLLSQIRTDDTGPAYYHHTNRFWRFKARPYGYIRNFENEVRDLFQYIDAVTPWEKAKKIRTYWEVREHHPMPQFNRPEVAIHRNQVGLLPSHMWETDKKTGRVKAVKDSVRDYQTQTPVPSWAQL